MKITFGILNKQWLQIIVVNFWYETLKIKDVERWLLVEHICLLMIVDGVMWLWISCL